MDSQLAVIDALLLAGLLNQPDGKFFAFPVSNHPAYYNAAENVDDHIKTIIVPLERSMKLGDIP